MSKIIVYKAIFRDFDTPENKDYDLLLPPLCPPDPEVKFVVFADVPKVYTYDGWEIRPQVFNDPNHRRRARHHKTMAHELFPDSEYTLWLDGVFQPKSSPAELIPRYIPDQSCHVVTHRHPRRSCLYVEARVVQEHGKDSPKKIIPQITRYRKEKFPRNFGLSETGAMLRRTNPRTAALNELWWREICAGSQRDQISFNYCLWKMGLDCRYFDGLTRTSPHFKWRAHFGE